MAGHDFAERGLLLRILKRFNARLESLAEER